MANCGVKRDQGSSYVRFGKHRQVGLFENIDRRFAEQQLQSSLANGIGFGVRFDRVTISASRKESCFAAHVNKDAFRLNTILPRMLLLRIFADSVSFRSFISWWTCAELARSEECHMRGLHAPFSDVHAYSVILTTFGMFCASCGLLHFSAGSSLLSI